LRSFNFIVLRVLEGAFIRDLQISFHASDINLQTRVVPLAAFYLNREDTLVTTAVPSTAFSCSPTGCRSILSRGGHFGGDQLPLGKLHCRGIKEIKFLIC
jgi:hypothetical protein